MLYICILLYVTYYTHDLSMITTTTYYINLTFFYFLLSKTGKFHLSEASPFLCEIRIGVCWIFLVCKKLSLTLFFDGT